MDLYGKMIDLHLHLDGSLSLASAKRLAAMQGMELPGSDGEILKRLKAAPGCRNLSEYLEKFDFPCSLLQTRETLSEAVYLLQEELKEQGLCYAELRFAPQKHCEKGLSQEEAVEAALEGLGRSDFLANLILCCMRGDDNEEKNRETLRVAAGHFQKGVCAVDLAGAEAVFTTGMFGGLFAYARELGLRYTIHAGEADGPASIYKALEYGAERLGHGVRCIEDRELIKILARRQIPLELCPTSNLNTAVFQDYREYPLPALMDSGVFVTLNTDNMSVSGTSLAEEFRHMTEAFSLTVEQIEELLLNSARAAFCGEEERAELIRKIQTKDRLTGGE